MLLFKRFFFSRFIQIGVLCAAVALSACGYRPLYGQNSVSTQSQADLASIYITPIDNRAGQMLRSALSHRLMPKATNVKKLFKLNVTIEESITELAVERDASATRGNLTLTAKYSLERAANGQTMTSGSTKTVSSYNILTSDFATFSAENDARSRAIDDLAETMRMRLAIYFQGPGSSAGRVQP
ncbi:LPS assembly lipoprotein LptE [Magnetovibrio blakemorei]|uniref:LPS-assembly lipoprotein n=1 Tax=Magnetovibrio blakemorei TaxID=28181 RepID=A0A1E5Q3Q0_9PROT|nr:LPS assembly lipoprotein LptE [Magnetovibrio blakemorei]OEJ64121.1 hypothetical protein BEN30_01620 [Magnetovibrio blakemorei]